MDGNSISGDNSESEVSLKSEKKSNFDKNSSIEQNIIDQKRFYSKAYKDRIFWSQNKMEDIRKRLNIARIKLISLERKDFDEIYDLINNNDFRVL